MDITFPPVVEDHWGLFCFLSSAVVFQILYLASSGVSWVLFDFYRKWDKTYRLEWDSRVVSSIHGALVSIIALQQLVYQKGLTDDPPFYKDKISECLVGTLAGYLLYDSLLLFRNLNNMSNVTSSILHHVGGLFTFLVNLFTGTGHFFALVFVFTEISTPTVNMRWMLYAIGMKDSQLYVVNGVVLALAFFIARILMLPWLCYYIYKHWERILLMPAISFYSYWFGFISISLLNIYWFYLIAKGLYKVLVKPKQKQV